MSSAPQERCVAGALASDRAIDLQASAAGFWNWEGRLQTPHGMKWVNVRARTRVLDALSAESTGVMLNVTQTHLRESQLRNLSTDLRQIASHLESVREAERARMARDLQPSVLDLGLKAGLRWMAEQYAKRYGIRVQTEISYQGEVGELIATELFRIAQEGLTNVVRHARARQAWVRCVDADAGLVCISVDDDGVGYTPQSQHAARPSLGLRGMRERAAVFGGSFQLDQSVHGGVCVRVCMPVAAGAEHG